MFIKPLENILKHQFLEHSFELVQKDKRICTLTD